VSAGRRLRQMAFEISHGPAAADVVPGRCSVGILVSDVTYGHFPCAGAFNLGRLLVVLVLHVASRGCPSQLQLYAR